MAWWVPKQPRKQRPAGHSPPAPPPPPLTTGRFLKVYPLLGVMLSTVLIPLCIALMRQGHPWMPMVLFPLPMTVVLNTGFDEEIAFCLLAAFQLPIYGLFMGYGHGIKGLPSFAIGLAVAHLICVGICFMSLL